MPKGKKLAPEVEALADRVGEFIQYWGFKKVHGRIWLHLFLSEMPLDAACLIKRLSVSKALVSMSLKDLLQYDVIEECGKSERSTQLYRANPRLMEVITGVLEQRERPLIATVSAAYQHLRDLSRQSHRDSGVDFEQLQRLGELIQSTSHALESFISFHRFELTGLKLPKLAS